jgi:hypothetical protein
VRYRYNDRAELLGQSWLEFARPVVEGEHPALNLNPGSTKRGVINDIKWDDYVFSNCGSRIISSAEHGLSFSRHSQPFKGIHRMKSKRNPGARSFCILGTKESGYL